MESAATASPSSFDPSLLLSHPDVMSISTLPGVARIEIEMCSVMGQQVSFPVIVVVATPSFRDRARVPLYIGDVRVCVCASVAVQCMRVFCSFCCFLSTPVLFSLFSFSLMQRHGQVRVIVSYEEEASQEEADLVNKALEESAGSDSDEEEEGEQPPRDAMES